MTELTIIKQDGGAYIDSREVAEVIGKSHNNLLRDIRNYLATFRKKGMLNFEPSSFFIESTYQSAQNKTMPCFLVSKMGCEMVAHKLIGEKGVLFTAAYVAKFNEMENAERAALEALAAMPTPRLGEVNACARIIVRGLKQLSASPEQVMRFLRNTYEPLGISVDFDTVDDTGLGCGDDAPRWYRASDIAKECGLYSLYGKPHAQAAACILNENLFIGAEHKRVETENYGFYTGVSVLYDDHALIAAMNWLLENGLPNEIYGLERTYHVQYITD